MPAARTVKLAAIGTVAGVFSGLFGVGGGIVVVPLVVLVLGYGPREATGTSLAAIVVTASVAAGVQAAYGNVHADKALLIGLPAVAGVMAGTWIQQRIEAEVLSLLFAGLLVVVAVRLLVG